MRARGHSSKRRRRTIAVVDTLAGARAVLARAKGGAVLMSPPGAAATLGVGYFRALVDSAAKEHPRVAIEAVMDCGADPGYALSALRLGFKHVVLRADARAQARVVDIGRQLGARVTARAPAVTALDQRMTVAPSRRTRATAKKHR